jgi:uncharacterized membrane protein
MMVLLKSAQRYKYIPLGILINQYEPILPPENYRVMAVTKSQNSSKTSAIKSRKEI